MAEKIVMPQLGESIAEGTIVTWLKQPGDPIKKDEDVLVISTDKVEAEIPAPCDGVLLSIDVPEGETVDVGTILGMVGAAGETVTAAPAPAPAAEPAPAAAPVPAAAPAPAPAVDTSSAEKIVMPQLGESIAEGTIVTWLKQPGDAIKKDEDVLVISTDKVEAEIPAPCDGVLVSINVPEGDTVDVGTILGYVGPVGSAIGAAPVAAVAAPVAAAAPVAVAAPVVAAPVALTGTVAKGRFVSPLVRKIAMASGINDAELDMVPGNGNNGRVTKKDIKAYIKVRTEGPAATLAAAGHTAVAPVQAAAAPRAAAAAPSVTFAAGARETVEKPSGMRKAIMKNMVLSKATSAHVHTFFDVDFTNIDKIRAAHKAQFKKDEGISLTYTTFIAAAVVDTLKRHPYINAEIRDGQLVFKKDIHVGMAVSIDTPKPGLMVPVIKGADNMNLRGLARSIADLANRVRTKKITADELGGGTFTITNPGNYGAIIGTPVINQPQVAILGVGRIQKEPVVMTVDGTDMIAIRNRGILSLGFDHRIIDGATADMFMADLKNVLENWTIAP